MFLLQNVTVNVQRNPFSVQVSGTAFRANSREQLETFSYTFPAAFSLLSDDELQDLLKSVVLQVVTKKLISAHAQQIA